MADPLALLAEKEVPERTNFFDPAASQDIMSRYANARRGYESSTALAESSDRDMRRMDMEDRRAREQVTWGREDAEYAERQNAKKMRGDFLRQMQSQIDPRSPDYTKQVIGFKAGLPPELQEDETINSILSSMNAEADDWRSQENTRASQDAMLERQQTMFREKAQFGKPFEHITEDDWKKYTLPDGSVDLRTLSAIGNERARNYKETEFNRRLDAVNQGRVQVVKDIDLSRKGRERRTAVDKYIVEDREAFPRQVDVVASEYLRSTGKKSVDPTLLRDNPKWRDAYAKADAWDKKPLDSELSAAFAYEDPEDYVDLVPGLTDSQKERRRMVWEHAHRDGAVEESDAAAPAPEEAPAAPSALEKQFPGVQAPARKTLTPEIIADLKKRAGGDPVKAKQLALDEGY